MGMVRFGIIGIVIAVAFTLYALVDAAMTDHNRARGVAKPVWVVLIVVLPVLGGILWFVIGKGDGSEVLRKAPEDDPNFTGNNLSSTELNSHMADLEKRLRELDDEVFPGESAGQGGAATGATGASGTSGASDAPDATDAPDVPDAQGGERTDGPKGTRPDGDSKL